MQSGLRIKVGLNDRVVSQSRDLTSTLLSVLYLYYLLKFVLFSYLFLLLFKNAFENYFLKETSDLDFYDLSHPSSLSHTFINKHKNIYTLQLKWSSSIIYANLKNSKKVISASQQDRVRRLRFIHLSEMTKK